MRRKDCEVTDKAWQMQVLRDASIVEVAMVDQNGEPYIVPVHYGISEDGTKLYVHSAMVGTKKDILTMNPKVAFNVTAGVHLVPNTYRPGKMWGLYRSVCGKGYVTFMSDPADKREAIRLLKLHYGVVDPHYNDTVTDDKLNRIVCIWVINITEMTGKVKGYPNPDQPQNKYYQGAVEQL